MLNREKKRRRKSNFDINRDALPLARTMVIGVSSIPFVTSFRSTHSGQPLPDRQQHRIPLIELLPELLLKAAEALAVLTARAFEFGNTRISLLEGLLICTTSLPLAVKKLRQFPRLQAMTFEQRVARGPRAFQLQCSALQLLLQLHNVGDQAGPAACEITESFTKIVLQICKSFLPCGRFNLLRREALLQPANIFSGRRCLAIQLVHNSLHLLLLFAANDFALVSLLGEALLQLSCLFAFAVQAHLRFHLTVAFFQLLLHGLVPLQVILRIFLKPNNTFTRRSHLCLVKFLLCFSSQVLECCVPFVGHLQRLIPLINISLVSLVHRF
ncbi:hypothetical protein BJX62DRAFT_229732 [Aspergillus germanicus]